MAGRSRKLGRSMDARRILGLRQAYSSLAYFQSHRAWSSSSRRVLRSLSQLFVAASAADALLVLATAGSCATQRATGGVGSVLQMLSGIGKAIEAFVILSDLGQVSSDAYKSYLRAQRAANTAQSCRQQLLQHDFELPKALMQAFEVADKFHIGSFVSSPSLNEISSVRSSRSALRERASDRPAPMPRYILDTLASLQQQLISFQGGFRSESQESVRSSQPAKSSIDASSLGSEEGKRGRASQQAGLGIQLLAKEFGSNLEAYLLAYHRWTSLRARIVRLTLAAVSGLSMAVVEAADAMRLLRSASQRPAARPPQPPSSARPLAPSIASSTSASGSRQGGWARHLLVLARCMRIAALAIGPTAGIALLVLRARDAAASASGNSRSSRGSSSSSSSSRRSKSSGPSRGVSSRGSTGGGRSSPTKTRTGSRRRNSGRKQGIANRKQDEAFVATSGHSREIGGLEAATGRLQAAPASGAAESAGAGAGASVARISGQSHAEQSERPVSASTDTVADHGGLSNERATATVAEGVPRQSAHAGRSQPRSPSGSVSYTRPAAHASQHGRALVSGLATSSGSYRGSGAAQHGAVATTEFGMAVLSETVEDEDDDEDGDGSTAGMDSGSQRTPLSAVGQYSGPPLTSHLSAASLSKLR